MSHRVSDLYAYTAKQDGVISKLNAHAIEVTSKDGSTASIALGVRYGSTPDFKIPQPIVTPLKVGDKVKQGDVVTYNTNYFELDPLDRTQVIFSMATMLNVALLEAPDTLEDSSVISERAAKLLETQMAKERDIVVDFKQSIHALVQEGDRVEVDTVLCILEDPLTADQSLFDESSIETLRLLAANAPKAKMAGIVGKVEVFYHGDVDELSPSLQEAAQESDQKRKRLARELKVAYTSGRVDDSLRVDGNPLLLDHAVIRITIVADVPHSVGDKLVVANQMKSVVSRVMTGVNETADTHEAVDMFFPYTSFSNRIVLSPDLILTTNGLLGALSKKAADVYFGRQG